MSIYHKTRITAENQVKTIIQSVQQYVYNTSGTMLGVNLAHDWCNTSAAKSLIDGFGKSYSEVADQMLIDLVDRRMKEYGILDVLINRYPDNEYRELIYNFFNSLRQ